MIDTAHALLAIGAMGAVTFGLRALPFVAGQWLKRHPQVERLGRFLPLAIMTLLLVHAVAGAAEGHAAGPWPELLAVTVVVGLQWRTRQPLLSILVGTALYVTLRNVGIAV
jgi:branched-subunit amino acid transport protein AzlD